MNALRRLAAGTLAASVTFVVVSATGCGTGAVGIDKCRSIEEARCEAGASCGLVDDVAQCKNYYRDQCLHGLAHGDTSTANIDTCVKTIQLAGDCAKKNGVDAKLSSCATPPTASPTSLTPTACSIVATPQNTVECGFLAAVPPEAGAIQTSDAGDAGDASSHGDAATNTGDAATDAQSDAKAE